MWSECPLFHHLKMLGEQSLKLVGQPLRDESAVPYLDNCSQHNSDLCGAKQWDKGMEFHFLRWEKEKLEAVSFPRLLLGR